MPYLMWYSRHHMIHILIGLVYAWILREWWNEFSFRYIVLALIGSEIIDMDHVIYMFFYGRHEAYAIQARNFLRQGQLGTLVKFLADNHKHNTSLASHNIYFLAAFFILAVVSFQFDWNASVVFFGAIVLHLLYDIFDDFWALGYMNENWKRLRRKK